MASQSFFETLATELFDNVISQIEIRDLITLCLVSRTIYPRAVPTLYQSWAYYGHDHLDKSLRKFLQTVIWRPDLADHVRQLDVREWERPGDLGFPEDMYEGPPYIRADDDDAEARERVWGYDPGYHLDKYGFENHAWDDEDYQDSEQQSSESEGAREILGPDSGDGSEEDIGQLVADQEPDIYTLLRSFSKSCLSSHELRDYWDRVIRLHFLEDLIPETSHILQTAAIEVGLDRNTLLKHQASLYAARRYFTLLVWFLVTSLPNLRQLLVVFTELNYWKLWQGPLQRMLEESLENKDKAILQNLETLHIYTSGAKGHLEYDLQLDFILPFMRLKNLRSFSTSTRNTFNNGHSPRPDMQPYVKNSNITSLSLEATNLVPSDALKLLSVPIALESLRWTQMFSRFSMGSCHAPFHNLIGDALRRHKDTLVHLDLDIRHRYCEDEGHAADPHASCVWKSAR